MKGEINQYRSPIPTSTGHLYLPVLVEVVTSTAPRSDQYYIVFTCIEFRSSSLYETTLVA